MPVEIQENKGFAQHAPGQFPTKAFAQTIRENLAKFQHDLDDATAGALQRVVEKVDTEETFQHLATIPKHMVAQHLGRICGELAPQGDQLRFINMLERVMVEGKFVSSSEVRKFKEAVGRHMPM